MSPLYNKYISTCCATQGQAARPHAQRMPNGGALERLDTAPLLPPTKTPPDPRLSRRKVTRRASACACGGPVLGIHCAHTADMIRRLNQRKNPKFALPAPAALSARAAHKRRELHAVSVDNRRSRLFLSTLADGRSRRLSVFATRWSDSGPYRLSGGHRGVSHTRRKLPHLRGGSFGSLGRGTSSAPSGPFSLVPRHSRQFLSARAGGPSRQLCALSPFRASLG